MSFSKQHLQTLLRGLASFAALVGGMGCLGWLALRIEAVPALHWGPWENSTGLSAPLVVLDAGHGGHDGGAVAHDRVEKVIALELAKRVRVHLEAQGVRVKMTRDTDVFIPLEKRSAIANEEHAAAFVSLHLNTSVAATEVSGIETYYSKRKTPFEAHPQAAEASEPSPQPAPASVTSAPPSEGRKSDGRDERLARCVQHQACVSSHAENRGIRERGYAVVLHTFCPAILVECGFLTHTSEAAKLSREDYRDHLAEGIARGIAEFLKTLPLKPASQSEMSAQEVTPNVMPMSIPEP